jgi:hypothetical protein
MFTRNLFYKPCKKWQQNNLFLLLQSFECVTATGHLKDMFTGKLSSGVSETKMKSKKFTFALVFHKNLEKWLNL